MNSESFSSIMQSIENEKFNDKSNERERKEQLMISEADTIDQLINHPGWKLIERQLKGVLESLSNELADNKCCDTLKKVNNRQIMIGAINLFLQSPKDFLNRRNFILERRKKWQNKKS